MDRSLPMPARFVARPACLLTVSCRKGRHAMADDTPHRRDVFLHDRTKTLLWVEWQRRRRHVDYGPAVVTCLQAMSLHLPTVYHRRRGATA